MITPNRCRKTFYKSPIPFHSKGGIEGLSLSLIKGILKSHKQYKTERFPPKDQEQGIHAFPPLSHTTAPEVLVE